MTGPAPSRWRHGGAAAIPARLSSAAPPSQAGLAAGLLAGLAMGLGLLLTAGWGSLALAEQVPLECRLGDGPWRPCQMEMLDVGLHWFLQIGSQRIEFRHSGDGAVRMQKGSGPWRSVSAQWRRDASLCWDGVCARGAIPLD